MPQITSLTIVLPVLNREELVVNTLDSIFRGGDVNKFSLIVVDNGSTDHTVEKIVRWIASHPSLDSRLLIETKKGVAAARNKGLTEVKTKYVMFFDSDDYIQPGFIDSINEAISRHPYSQLFYWDILRVIGNKKKRTGSFRLKNLLADHLVHSTFATQRYIVRTDFLTSVGNWDENLPVWNDYELGVRMLSRNPSCVKINLPDNKIPVTFFTNDSISATPLRQNAHLRAKALDTAEKSLVSHDDSMFRLIAYRRVILATECEKNKLYDISSRLIEQAHNSSLNNLQIRTIRFIHKYFGRGSWFLVNLF